MNVNLEVNIDKSIEQLRSMSQLVERALNRSIHSFLNFDAVTARLVIEEDKVINSFEIDVDNSTYNVLATHAHEIHTDTLRSLISIQKINPILERIGDHAVNIAESAETLSLHANRCELFELAAMADLCKGILRDAIASLFTSNETLAKDVLTRDDRVDRFNIDITTEVKTRVMNREGGVTFETALDIIRICKNLERIGDLASNIAEEALFSISGKVVKHQPHEMPVAATAG